MKSILISIQPKWYSKIASGKKTVEVRKTRPKLDTPFKCYIYCTKSVQKNRIQKVNDTGAIYFDSDLFCPYLDDEIEVLNGKVIGEFVCDYVSHSNEYLFDNTKLTMQNLIKASCMSFEEINKYRGGKNIFAWHISELKIYDKPKELNEFWAYNEEWHKCYENGEDYCCYNATNQYGELLSECAEENVGVNNCYRCWEEWSGWCHRVTRPPQSWCYVEEKKLKNEDNDNR